MSESQKMSAVLARLKKTFLTQRTRSVEWRLSQLTALKKMIQDNEIACKEALAKDLGRGEFESFALELLPSILEIDHCVQHLSTWMQPTFTSVPGVMAPATAEVVYEPYGVCLVISAFNYPIQLSLGPMLGAIMAGNCCVLKPSEMASACEQLLAKLIPQYLDKECFEVVCGGVETTTALLEQPWDKIFFTGSTRVGKIVMKAAANHLIPVSLELGGKSPTFVDESIADFELVSKRICWGKFSNAGQTCIAPDYVMVHEKVYDRLVEAMKKTIKTFYGAEPEKSPDFSRIITEAHVQRLQGMLEDKPGNIVCGGKVDVGARYIEPTMITDVRMNSKLMQEEIFGPLLPIIKIKSIDEGIALVRSSPVYDKPLSLYVFAKNRAVVDKITNAIPSGGVLVNDALFHFGNYFVPFGGVGPSGLGGYHGKYSFECFSHRRSIMRRDDHMILDAPVRYPPYTKTALNIFKAAAKLPPIPPVSTLVRLGVVITAVAASVFYGHKTGLLHDFLRTLTSK